MSKDKVTIFLLSVESEELVIMPFTKVKVYREEITFS